jgi:hypothetical protein
MAEKYPDKITHTELVELGRDWLIRPFAACAEHGHYGCNVVITELVANTWGGEIPDVIGFCQHKSILIECKASRGDFAADKHKPFRENADFGLGSQRWFMAPMGVIPLDTVPEKWGLLEVTSGRSILPVKKPEKQTRNYESEINLLLSLFCRLNIAKDRHIAIKRHRLNPAMPVKDRATFYVSETMEMA